MPDVLLAPRALYLGVQDREVLRHGYPKIDQITLEDVAFVKGHGAEACSGGFSLAERGGRCQGYENP